VVLGFLME